MREENQASPQCQILIGGKKATDEPIYEEVRAAILSEISCFGADIVSKFETILDAIEWRQLIVFNYSGSDRVVAPFVFGLSSDGNPLLRGFQLEGNSRSGKGAGWRVFQVIKMDNLENHQDFFNSEEFEFDQLYPWIYKVFKTL